MNQIDARGLSCPEPVVMLRKAMMTKENAYEVIVDNTAARENITRYARHQGYQVTVCRRMGNIRSPLRNNMVYIATFYSHFGAIRFKKLCQAQGIAARLLEKGCHICYRAPGS